MSIEVSKLKQAIAKSNTIRNLLVNLGYNSTNATQRINVCELIKQNNIDISHFKHVRRTKWNNIEQMQQFVDNSKNFTDLLKQMGLQCKGGNLLQARKTLRRLGIDHSHFTGRPSKQYSSRTTIPLQEILEGKHPTYSRFSLKNRLLKAGIKNNECEICKLQEIWNNQNINMQLDHINGISTDHRLENLQMICPNCHSQTLTYAGRNKK
jgi:hypothetical protein